MHPLFGRRFAVISLSTSRRGTGHAVVAYKGSMRISPDGMRIRIPLSATQLALPQRALGSKLTLESVTELVTLAQQSEILCPSLPTPSGTVLTPRCKRSSLKNSKPSAKK